MSSNNKSQLLIKEYLELNSSIVEEKIIKATGDIQIRRYYKGRVLGSGTSSKCYELSCLENKNIFAAKVIPKNCLDKSIEKQGIINEIKIQKELHHPKIVAFKHYFEDTENIYILLEICQNQTLYELLKRRKRLTEIEVQYYAYQIIQALKYLHFQRVIHRNLKLANLFLTDKMELKVGDFGLATKLEHEGEKKRTVCGTPNYVAPEILNEIGYSYEVDIWSLGVVIYTLLIGKPPFETKDVKTICKRIKMNEYTFPKNTIISEAAKDLIEQILILDPLKRPSLDEILAHDFFHQGTSIPKLLPTYTLTCAPTITYIRQFISDANKDGIENMTLKIKRLLDIRIMKKELEKKLEINIQLKGPDIWVTKWIDYSSKYGLGYLLNNGFIGIHFKDSSKIILNPLSKQFFYIEGQISDKKEIINSYNLEKYPKELQKKVTLFNHFQNYLEGEGNYTDLYISQDKEKKIIEDKNTPFIYVKKWMRTRDSIIFRLTNKIVQVSFQDKTEIIISRERESKTVTYCNKKGERMTYLLSTALKMQNYEITKRLNYTKNILKHILNMKQQKKLGKDSGEEMVDSKNLAPKLSMNQEKIYGKVSEKVMVETKNKFPLKIENIETIQNEKDEIEEIEEDEEVEEDIYIIFNSTDQLIKDFGVRCQKTEKMLNIKKFLLKHNSQLKNKNIYFLTNGHIVNVYKTIEENKIKNKKLKNDL